MALRPDRAIVLIGAMGSGKSAIGAALAHKLGRTFLDTDQIVEARAGRSVQEIFDGDGERAFRALEAEAVKEAAGHPGAVVACGGGAVLDAGNVEALRSAGVVIYLRVDPPLASTRIGTGEGRPLLKDGGVESRLAELIATRAPAYEAAADLIVDANKDVDETLGEILEALQQ